MGACQSKKVEAPPITPIRSIEDELNDSLHGKNRTTRQKLARYYEDIHISEAYNVLSILGQGSMGEVTLVEKKEVHTLSKVKKIDQEIEVAAIKKSNQLLSSTTTLPSKRRKYACKTVNTLRMKNSELREFLNETDILRDLDHPNIVQLFEVYRQKRRIWIVTELCFGGDLWTRADDNTEEDVVIILEQITRAVAYMHKRNVCHRDIKLENVLYTDLSPSATVKLIDFGLSNKFTRGEKMLKSCGTVYTAAPELLLKMGCTEQTDIWSIGVVAFILLSQEYPFLKHTNEIHDPAKLQNLENATYSFGDEWDHRNITSVARKFISSCLKKNPFMRCSALDALDYIQSPWIPHLESLHLERNSDICQKIDYRSSPQDSVSITSHADTSNSDIDHPSSNHFSESKKNPLYRSTASTNNRIRMSTDMLQGMSKFGQYGELKKTILMTISYDMDKSSLQGLSELFIALDTSQDGTLTLLDLKRALERMKTGRHLDNYGIEEIFKGVDVDASGQIHYNEFLAAVVESQGLITMEHLAEAFDRIDNDGKGYISKGDLKQLLGQECDEGLVNRMLEEADLDPNGKVDYDQFLKLMIHDQANGY